MSFAPNRKIFRNGKTFSQSLHLKMSVNAENITHASKTMAKISTQTTISPEVFEEKIAANLEPLNEQISTLTQ